MKTNGRSLGIILGTTLLFFLQLLSSCADRDAPAPETVQKLFVTFFEAQGYKIVSLDLGAIEGAPLAQKTYGNKRAFYVTVKRLVLEGKRQQVTRENGTVAIRQRSGAVNKWEIERWPVELAP